MQVNDYVSFSHVYRNVEQLDEGKSGTKRVRVPTSGSGVIVRVFKKTLKVYAGSTLGSVSVAKADALLVGVQSTIDDEPIADLMSALELSLKKSRGMYDD